MQSLRIVWLALSLCLLASATVNAELTPQMKIGGQTLILNGAGKRTKTLITIYESGLYLQSPSRDAKSILDADELMAIRVKITSGFVDRSSLLTSLQDSLRESTGGRPETIAKETGLFLECLKDEVQKNDVYDFVHVPGTGVYVLKNGKLQGKIEGLPFKRALFGIWLSDAPVDKELRQAMLSGPKSR